MRFINSRILPVLFLCLLMSVQTLFAEESDKPFAEKKIVLQISDNDPFKQTLVLNVADNLVNIYGMDKVDVEIVAFGPGLRLLLADNSNMGRIDTLTGSGVRFAACANTMKKFEKQLGHPPEINPNARVVPGGVPRIMDLIDQGYYLIKP